MRFEYTPYILPLLIAGVSCLWVAYYAWSHRSVSGASALALLGLAVADYTIGYGLEIAGADLTSKMLAAKFEYFGVTTIPMLWLVFCYNYFNQNRQLPLRLIAALGIIPLITVGLVFTTESHGLIWTRYAVERVGAFSHLDVEHGAWFPLFWVYSYFLLIVAAYFIIRLIRYKHGVYRGQVAALMAAAIAPLVGNLLYISKLVAFDATPFGFAVAVIVTAWGIFRFQLINLVPLARDAVVEAMEAGMIVIDAQGRVADINPAAAALIGLPPERVIHQPAGEVLSRWPDLTKKYASVLEALDEISVGEGEDQRWFELSLSPLRNKDQSLIGRLVTFRDITVNRQVNEQLRAEIAERKMTEFLLQESEARYRQIVENADELIYRTNADGNITYANSAILRLFGMEDVSAILGKHYLEFIVPAWRARVQRFYVHQFLSGDATTYFEFPILQSDGHELWLGQNVHILREANQIVSFQAVARDITAIKRAQEALALARDQAQEASHFKGDLLARVSHELRTPLAGVLGYAELLRDQAFGPLSKDQTQAVETIAESSEYLSTVISDLMDQAQIEAKKLVLQFGECSPAELLHHVEEMMAVLAQKRGLTLRTVLEPDAPARIYSDEQRLRQIVINLVANAIKFTKEGEVCVRIFQADPLHWAIQVSDTGIGIPPEAQATIFEPFQKVKSLLTRDNRGIGLGLSITKQLVALLDGQITLTSEIGKGSTFLVTLPIRETGR